MIELSELARRIRIHSVQMTHDAHSSHVGSCLSCADILAVLYSKVLRVRPSEPHWPDRDRFIMSKGHASAALYAVLAERGFFPVDDLKTFYKSGLLSGHVNHKVPGVDVSTGSLGHGLSIACGMALAAKRDKKTYRVYALLSDGDLDEGSTWEAVMFARHHELDNLVAIVDCNGLQACGKTTEVLNLEPLAEKWRAFNWNVWQVVRGNDVDAVSRCLSSLPFYFNGEPKCVIARTVKGKGVSFMESRTEWHYKQCNDEELALALKELGEC